MKKQIMKRAWELRKSAATEYGCKISEIEMSECLREAWAEAKGEKKMENLTGRKMRVGNGECFYHEPAGTKFIVLNNSNKNVVGKFDTRNSAVKEMIEKGISTGIRHSVLADEPNNDMLILLESF